MRKTLFRTPIVYLLLLQQMSTICWGGPITKEADGQRTTLGILRLGEAPTSLAAKAYPLVERRVQRWLENLEFLHARVERLGSVTSETLLLESEGKRLDLVTGELGAGLSSGKETGSLVALVEEMRRSRSALPFASRYTPAVQRSLVAEAHFLWREGRKSQALHEVDMALRLNPDGKIEGLEPWDEASPDFELAVEALTEKERSSAKRSCLLDLSVMPAAADITINGFKMGSRRSFSFPLGGAFLVRAEFIGHQSVERAFRCERIERKHWDIRLRPAERGMEAPVDVLSRVIRQHGVGSLVLIEPTTDQFRIYFYTSGPQLVALPLKRPLRVADVLQEPANSELPVATDAFLDLVQRQGLPDASALEAHFGNFELPRSVESLDYYERHSGGWYNNWYFWAIAGAIVGGAALAGFVSGYQPANSHGGLSIKLE